MFGFESVMEPGSKKPNEQLCALSTAPPRHTN